MIRSKTPVITIIIFTLVALICIVPLLYIVSISVSSDMDISYFGYRLIPKNIDFTSYMFIFKTPQMIIDSYLISILITVLGTAIGVLLTCAIAYPMTRKDYRYSKILTFMVVIPLLVQGGLVPWYILISKILNLRDTIWVLFLPYTIVPWFAMLAKGFLSNIPIDVIESSKIDGAGEIRIFFKMILPMSKPGVATIALFCAFMFWNDWWLSLLYIDNQKLIPLQYMLYRLMSNIRALTNQISTGQKIDITQIPTESARMAMAVLATMPMLVVFPFFQKYFVKGLIIGSIKG